MPDFPNNVPAPVAQKQEKIEFKKKYFISLKGILRLALMILLIAGWISSIEIIKNSRFSGKWPEMSSTRETTMTIYLLAWIYHSSVYLIYLLNLIQLRFVKNSRFVFEVAVFVWDIIFLFAISACSIACINRVTEFKENEEVVYEIYDQGAVTATFIFGMISSVLTFFVIGYRVVEYWRTKQITPSDAS